MERWGIELTKPGGWLVTGILAGISILPELPWQFLWGSIKWIADFFGVAAVGFAVIQSTVGSAGVGLTVAWLLIGHLTYQYTHYLYPDEFADVVGRKSFRAMTAFASLYFGVICWGALDPRVVPLEIPLATPSTMITRLYVPSILGGISIFTLYLVRWHPETVGGEENDFAGLTDQFFSEPGHEEEKPSGLWRTAHRWSDILGDALIPVLVCVIVGLVGLILNLFYPIPEAILFFGLVAHRVWPGTGLDSERTPRHEVDLRLLDSISAATRNLKGMTMLASSLLGMAVSGLLFFTLFVLLATAIGSLLGGNGSASPVPYDWGGQVVFGVATLSLLMMGLYSLVHWARQLERIEPYARRWESNEENADDGDEESLPARPPGFLVPSFSPFVAMIVVISPLPFLNYRWVLGVLLLAAVVVMAGGLLWAWRHDSQSLTCESRDLFLTVAFQFSFVGLLGMVDWTTLQVHIGAVQTVALSLVLLTCLYYYPEVADWQSEADGVRKILGDGPTILFAFSCLGIAKLQLGEFSPLLVGVLFGPTAISVFHTIDSIHSEFSKE